MIITKYRQSQEIAYTQLDLYSLGKFDGYCGLDKQFTDESYLKGYWEGFTDWIEGR
jgi:hypothetical protein